MDTKRLKKVMLIGPPGVGKTLLFQRLIRPGTERSSFFPGTEAVVSRGMLAFNKEIWELIDTPSVWDIYGGSLNDTVVLSLILAERPAAVLQVLTPDTMVRTIFLSIQLAELGIPFLLVINKKDSALYTDQTIDLGRLYSLFHAHIVVVSALLKGGLRQISGSLSQVTAPRWVGQFEQRVARGIEELVTFFESTGITKDVFLPARCIALLLILRNPVFEQWFRKKVGPGAWKLLMKRIDTGKFAVWSQTIERTWREASRQLAPQIVNPKERNTTPFLEFLNTYIDHPFWGWFFLAAILYLVFFMLVKVASGIVVTFLETEIFGKYIIPGFISLISQFPLSPFIKDMFIGDYGLLTMGLTYLVD